ncbi:MAG: hypothetical protein JSR82_23320 [Verrucomicrobia bacterium]|nr:hypothetical protein [Verrucomicrobiota bacterium]
MAGPPASRDERLLARLHLSAVLPAAAALSSGDCDVALRIDDELAATLRARAGCVEVLPAAEAAVVLQFRDAAALNALFRQRRGALPRPTRGGWRVLSILRAIRLLQRMGAVLKGAPGVPREEHARQAFGVALRALPLLALGDPGARRILANSPSGPVTLEVPAVGFARSVELSPTGVRLLETPAERPRARIVVNDLEAALANLAGTADGPAQVALGRVSVTGFLPLAEALDALLARVDAWLGPRAR